MKDEDLIKGELNSKNEKPNHDLKFSQTTIQRLLKSNEQKCFIGSSVNEVVKMILLIILIAKLSIVKLRMSCLWLFIGITGTKFLRSDI